MQLNNLCTFLDGQLNICLFSTRDKSFPFAMSGIFGDIILLSLLDVVAVAVHRSDRFGPVVLKDRPFFLCASCSDRIGQNESQNTEQHSEHVI